MPILRSRYIATFVLSALVGASAGLAPRVVMSASDTAVTAQKAAPAPKEAPGTEASSGGALSPEALDQVVGPIALYPDDLIAIVLPASTFPLDIVKASRFLEK